MGTCTSSFHTVRTNYPAEKIFKGNWMDPNNILGWNFLRLNLSGDPIYDPTLPWVSKYKGGLMRRCC